MSIEGYILRNLVFAKAAFLLNDYLVLAQFGNAAVFIQQQRISCAYQRGIHSLALAVQQNGHTGNIRLVTGNIIG